MKALRKLLAFLVVIGLFGGGFAYAINPSNDIKNSEKLANAKVSTQLEDLNTEFIKNISYGNSKLSTSVSIDNEMFTSILKSSTMNNPELQEGSYKLVSNAIDAKLPVKLAFLDSQISAKVKVVGSNNKVELILDDAKIGKVPIPDFALEKYLKEALSGSGVIINGNTITINSLGLPVTVESVDVVNGEISATASITNAQLLQYGSQALRGYLKTA